MNNILSISLIVRNEEKSLAVSGQATPILTLSYDSQGRLSGITRTMNGGSYVPIVSSYGYDTANRLTSITDINNSNNSTLVSFTYAYNAASQVTGYTGPEG